LHRYNDEASKKQEIFLLKVFKNPLDINFDIEKYLKKVDKIKNENKDE